MQVIPLVQQVGPLGLRNRGERNSLSGFMQSEGQRRMRKIWKEESWNKKQS